MDQNNFPQQVGAENLDSQQPVNQAEQKKRFQNNLFDTDSLTKARGYINEVKKVGDGDAANYFVRVGLFTGSESDGQGGFKPVIVNYDLLIGSTLRKFAESVKGTDIFKGVPLGLEIRNLHSVPEIYDNKPTKRDRGILEVIHIGFLN
jgi:hypothetical protein